MSLNVAVVYHPNDTQGQPLLWFNLASNPQHASERGDFIDFHHWLEKKQVQADSRHSNLYLFLAQELVSFHQVNVPEGVKRNVQKLLPVLLEEQIAQDIDEIAVHYVAEAINETEDDTHANTAVWDKKALAQLMGALKTSTGESGGSSRRHDIRIKACLPISACDGLADMLPEYAVRADFWQILPQVPSDDRVALKHSDSGDQLNVQLESHRWNLVSPEQSEISPLYGVFALGLLAASLYLVNQWLSL